MKIETKRILAIVFALALASAMAVMLVGCGGGGSSSSSAASSSSESATAESTSAEGEAWTDGIVSTTVPAGWTGEELSPGMAWTSATKASTWQYVGMPEKTVDDPTAELTNFLTNFGPSANGTVELQEAEEWSTDQGATVATIPFSVTIQDVTFDGTADLVSYDNGYLIMWGFCSADEQEEFNAFVDSTEYPGATVQ